MLFLYSSYAKIAFSDSEMGSCFSGVQMCILFIVKQIKVQEAFKSLRT